jgi:hypothetical protein
MPIRSDGLTSRPAARFVGLRALRLPVGDAPGNPRQ